MHSASTEHQSVPLTVTVVSPGVTVHSPVVAFCEKVAAGTVITPAFVANTPLTVS